jgi:uncharacterized protein (DUF1501 family)
MSLNRRTLLKSAAATAALSLVPRRARAQTVAGKNLLIVFAPGGWDPTYVFDPKDPSLTTVDAPTGTLKPFGQTTLLTDPARPSVDAFFSAYGAQTAVVNGVQVRSIVHPDCWKRILTGTASDANPDLGAITAWTFGRDLPMPYFVLGSVAYTGQLASICGHVGSTGQLLSLLDPKAAYPPAEGNIPSPRALADPFPNPDETLLIHKYTRSRADRERAVRGAYGYNKARLDDFMASTTRGEKLKAYASSFSRGLVRSTKSQVDLALEGLSSGLCWSATVQAGGWDSHTMNSMQSGYFEDLFSSLKYLADELASRPGRSTGAKMLDETVVAVVSEMGRTPKLNAALGKDHWPVTSAMVFGAGVRGGLTMGGTTDAMGARNVSLTTGALDENGAQLQTSNLAAGLLTLVGVDPSQWFQNTEVFRGFIA